MTGDDSCRANYESDNLTIIIASISLAVFGILLALVNHYKIEIKIWLYSHNIKWPISEESLDQDKKYDAFLSYSHKDEELIVKHLVPGLEGGNTPFKLCLHLRDWVIGDWIPQQIARSVDESRRTIIVLSRNYLNSVWGRTEFRAAYSSALNEKRSRIIVILYGDISTSDLDTELKAYLSMNTYIKWGDDNFWEKLRYALPHRPNLIKNTRTKIIVPENLNPLLLT